jgi:hypothetical protein
MRGDIEGSECKMVRGALKTIDNSPDITVFLEF